jgi:nickel transport protein
MVMLTGARVLTLCLALVSRADAHEVRCTVQKGEAVVLRIDYADGRPLAGVKYEVVRAGENGPVQAGTTNERGEVAFRPVEPGSWRLRAFSEDGHGVDFSFEVDATGALSERAASTTLRQRIVVGVAVLFGFFGALSLLYRARRR